MKKHFNSTLNILIILSMILPLVVAVPQTQADAADLKPLGGTGIFRASILIPGPAERARLTQSGIRVLSENGLAVIVLATGDQLALLSKMGFKPSHIDDLNSLVSANAKNNDWLTESLHDTLRSAANLWQQVDTAATNSQLMVADADRSADAQAALNDLHALLNSFSIEQLAAIETLISPDSDGDGLTDTEELWWCTDPNNPNSDGDAMGYTDGQEVDALLDATLSRTVRWNYGPPFGPPNAWPDFNGQDGDPNTPACNDGDYDTIPDYAEAYVVGTRVGTQDDENTDGDKFDDGQEFFGKTYCPGGSASCDYGLYPRTQDLTFITNAMPSWVRPPGDSPFVAAYPVIGLLVDPDTLAVTAKEIRTVERTVTEGEEISTGFAETRGNSTTVGTIDTNTHSTLLEHSTTEGGIEPASSSIQAQLYPSVMVFPPKSDTVEYTGQVGELESNTSIIIDSILTKTVSISGEITLAPDAWGLEEPARDIILETLKRYPDVISNTDQFAIGYVRKAESWRFVSVIGLKGDADLEAELFG